VFGYLEADPRLVHGQDWSGAVGAVDAALKSRLSQPDLYRLEEGCRQRANSPPEEILQDGSGWGALELYRREHSPDNTPLPASCVFPPQTLGAEQQKWIALLEKGSLPTQDPTADPGEWMVQPEWQTLLDQSVQTETGRNWFAWLHLGVMRMEQLETSEAAESAWQESLRMQPSAWAYRNLAVLRLRQKNQVEALEFYEKAWALAVQQPSPPPALAAEYLHMLVGSGQFEKGLRIFQSLPGQVQDTDRVQILRGQIAMELGDLQAVEQVLERPYAVIREGETVLSDLWFELQARRESARTGRALDEALRQDTRRRFPPPGRIDFRSFNE
jgi:tetratricopeptide (TPR) repeat protein